MGGFLFQQRMSMPNPDDLNLSVVIITLNEERNLRRCLGSLPSGCEICILDSGSVDQTLRIAADFNAKSSLRPFTNHAEQKNAALDLATRDWILSIDADECLDETARLEVTRIACSKSQEAGFRISRQLIFMGKPMRFGKTNDAPLRLFRRGQGQFNHAIHESLEVRGSIGALKGKMHHYSYADLTDYFSRFNRYTTKVAENHFAQGKKSPAKFTLACRFWVDFLQRYFFRLGLLDGYPGYVYALVSSIYAFTKYEKLRELSQQDNSRPD